MMSASWNSRIRVMSIPAFAMSISKRWCFDRCVWRNTTNRSHRKGSWRQMLCFKPTTVILSVILSLTSSFAFTPLLFNASIRRLAATAAPPVFSLVLTNSTLIIYGFRVLHFVQKYYKKAKIQNNIETFCLFIYIFDD